MLARVARRPARDSAVNRDRDGSTTSVANLNAWHAANPPHFIKDTDPAITDQEPGGVFHSMIAFGRYLYVVETHGGSCCVSIRRAARSRPSMTCRSITQNTTRS